MPGCQVNGVPTAGVIQDWDMILPAAIKCERGLLAPAFTVMADAHQVDRVPGVGPQDAGRLTAADHREVIFDNDGASVEHHVAVRAET